MKIYDNQLSNILHNTVKTPNIFCLYGTDETLSHHLAQTIKDYVVKNLGAEYVSTDYDNFKFNAKDLLSSRSIFGHQKRIIKIYDIHNQDLQSLYQIIERPNQSIYLILSFASIQKNHLIRKFCEKQEIKHALAIACYPYNQRSANIFIQQYVKKQTGISLSSSLSQYIFDRIGETTYGNLVNELNKLILYIGDNKHINTQLIDQVMTDVRQDLYISEAISCAIKKDYTAFVYHLDSLISQGVELIAIVYSLIQCLNKMVLLKLGYKNPTSNSYGEKKSQEFMQEYLMIWTLQDLNNAIDFMLNIEYELKCNALDISNMKQSFLLQSPFFQTRS